MSPRRAALRSASDRPSKAERADRRALLGLAAVLILVALGTLGAAARTLHRGVVDLRSRNAAEPVYVRAEEAPRTFYGGVAVMVGLGGSLLYVGLRMARHAVRPADVADKTQRPPVPTRRRRPHRRVG